VHITEITDNEKKSRLCEGILRALPDWFGMEEGLAHHVNEARGLPFFAAVSDEGETVGFVSLKYHNASTAEVSVIGVLQPRHRQGAGRALIEKCKDEARRTGREFLTVKTIADTDPHEGYARTRKFYESVGFRPLEIFPLHWDADNPCLFMAMYLGKQ